MSQKKSQATLKKQLSFKGEIIQGPNLEKFTETKPSSSKPSTIKLTPKYLYYKNKRIPILHLQKAGYDKLLKLLIKEIER